MTNNNAMQTSVLNGNIRNNDMIPTVSNVSEQESGSSRKQRHSSFQKNQIVLYKKNGKKSKAIIRSVHFDDELVPYYTIELDGREKQTDSAHLEACSPSIPQEREKQTDHAHLEACSPSIPQEQQHHDTFYPVPRLDPSPYIVVGSKRSKRRKLNEPKTPNPYVVVGSKRSKRRKLNARKKTVTFGYLQVRPIEKNYREVEEEEERIEEEENRMREMERNREVDSALIPSLMIVGVISSFYFRCIRCIGSTVIAGRTAMMGLLSHTQGWGALAIGSAKARTNGFLRCQLVLLKSLCISLDARGRSVSTKAFRYKTSQIFHKIVSTVALWIVVAAIILSLYFICQQNISATIIAVAFSFHRSREAIFRGIQGTTQVIGSAKMRTNQFLRCRLAFLESTSILGDHQPRPEDCSPSSLRQEEQQNDTFFLLPRLGQNSRKLNPRQKRVTWGFVQVRSIEMLSSEERLLIRKELGLKEMIEKNYLEVEEEERIEEERIEEEEKRMREMERSMSSSSRFKAQIDDTEEEDDYGSAFVNDDEEDNRDDGYGEAVNDVVDFVDELTVIVNEKKEKKKKKKKSTSPRRSLRLQTSNLLGSGYTESGRRFSMRLKAMK